MQSRRTTDLYGCVGASVAAWQLLFLLQYRETKEVFSRVPARMKSCGQGFLVGGRWCRTKTEPLFVFWLKGVCFCCDSRLKWKPGWFPFFCSAPCLVGRVKKTYSESKRRWIRNYWESWRTSPATRILIRNRYSWTWKSSWRWSRNCFISRICHGN